MEVIAGPHDFANKTGFEQTSHVADFVNHEGYGGGVGPDDVAVIKLKTPFKFTEKVHAKEIR